MGASLTNSSTPEASGALGADRVELELSFQIGRLDLELLVLGVGDDMVELLQEVGVQALLRARADGLPSFLEQSGHSLVVGCDLVQLADQAGSLGSGVFDLDLLSAHLGRIGLGRVERGDLDRVDVFEDLGGCAVGAHGRGGAEKKCSERTN